MMSVLRNGHNSKVLKEMMNMYREQCMVDCILAAEGKYIKVHSVILSSCSPFFKLLLSEEKRNDPIIILKGVSYNDLVNIVEFIYNGCVDVPEKEWEGFIGTAQYLQIGGLFELTEVVISRDEHISRFEENDNEGRVDIVYNNGGTLERNNDVEEVALESELISEPSESDTTSCTPAETLWESTQVDEPRATAVVAKDLKRSHYLSDGSDPKLEQQDQREMEQVKNHCLFNMDSNKENDECHEVNSQQQVDGEEMVWSPARNMEVNSPLAGMKGSQGENYLKAHAVGGSHGEHETSPSKVLKSVVSQSEMDTTTHCTASPIEAVSNSQEVKKGIIKGRKNLKRKEVKDILEMDVCEEINKAGSQTVKPPKIYKCKYLACSSSQVCPTHSVTKNPFSTPNEKQEDAEKGEKCSKTRQNLSVRLVRLQQLDHSENPYFAVAPISKEQHEEKTCDESQGCTAVEDSGPSPSTSASKEEGDLLIGRKCSVCSRIFRGALQLSSHMLNHSPEGAVFQSKTESATSALKGAVPRQVKRRIKRDKHLICKGHEQPSSSTGSNAHEIPKPQSCDRTVEEIHPDSHPFSCGECGVSFKQKISLIQHMNEHRDRKLLLHS